MSIYSFFDAWKARTLVPLLDATASDALRTEPSNERSQPYWARAAWGARNVRGVLTEITQKRWNISTIQRVQIQIMSQRGRKKTSWSHWRPKDNYHDSDNLIFALAIVLKWWLLGSLSFVPFERRLIWSSGPTGKTKKSLIEEHGFFPWDLWFMIDDNCWWIF